LDVLCWSNTIVDLYLRFIAHIDPFSYFQFTGKNRPPDSITASKSIWYKMQFLIYLEWLERLEVILEPKILYRSQFTNSPKSKSIISNVLIIAIYLWRYAIRMLFPFARVLYSWKYFFISYVIYIQYVFLYCTESRYDSNEIKYYGKNHVFLRYWSFFLLLFVGAVRKQSASTEKSIIQSKKFKRPNRKSHEQWINNTQFDFPAFKPFQFPIFFFFTISLMETPKNYILRSFSLSFFGMMHFLL
jgi:hypothetical protein